jgi:prevent-host-death family protein
MSVYSIAKAKDNLSKLVDEAVAGEEVAITRHGKVVAYVRPAVERPVRQPSHELVAQIAERAKSRPSLARTGSTSSAGCGTANSIDRFRRLEGVSIGPEAAGIRKTTMATYSIAQAKDQLSKLVDEALAGETVTITRHGKVVAELRPAPAVDAGRWSPELIDEIAARAKSLPSLGESAADIVRRMRDEYP